MEYSEEDARREGRQPFDFGIKRLKKELALGGMSKKDINKTVKLYKTRVYERVEEVRAKMQAEYDAKHPKGSGILDAIEKGDEDASDK